MLRLFLVALVVLAAAVAACGGGTSGPVAITNITFSASEDGPATTTFSPADHTIYAEATLNQIATNVPARFVWIAVDTTEGQDIEVASTDFNATAVNILTGQVELPNDWPTGTYRLDIYLNDALNKSAEFTIE